MKQKILRPLQNFVRWLFGAPFQNLPPEFGDPVPSDLRAFEAETEEIQHRPQGHIHPSSTADHKPPKMD